LIFNFLPDRTRNGNCACVHRCLWQAGWSWGWVSAIDSNGRTIWIADAHRDDGKHFVVQADEKLTAFVEFELAIRLEREHLPLTVQISGGRSRKVSPRACQTIPDFFLDKTE